MRCCKKNFVRNDCYRSFSYRFFCFSFHLSWRNYFLKSLFTSSHFFILSRLWKIYKLYSKILFDWNPFEKDSKKSSSISSMEMIRSFLCRQEEENLWPISFHDSFERGFVSWFPPWFHSWKIRWINSMRCEYEPKSSTQPFLDAKNRIFCMS